MNRVFLSKAIFAVWLLTAIAANAQTKTETAALNFSTETPTVKKDFSSNPKISNNRAKIISREFNRQSTSNTVESNPTRRQTYVRPTKEQRLKRYLSDAFGVPALIGAAFGATFNQIGNDPPEWKKTIGGFGKRFASSYGTNAIRNTVSYGLSEAFKLDNRFEKSGQKNFGKRLRHVFVGSYATRTKTGGRIPDFPYFVGTYSASIIANEVWYPKRFSYQDGLRDGTISLGVRFGVNLLREFVFPK